LTGALDLHAFTGRGDDEFEPDAVGRLGDHTTALAACQQALTLLKSVGERAGEADSWDSLGYALHHLGCPAEAVRHYEQAMILAELDHPNAAAVQARIATATELHREPPMQ
jgi:tetratricopeptide (TPR) repeat protein